MSCIVPSRVFIHGLESSGKGTKGTFFRKMYPDMVVKDFSGNFQERMLKLNSILAQKDELIIVGSSYGGLMAAVFSINNFNKIRKLILLAPALNHMPPEIYPDKRMNIPVYIYHGNQDEVVPYSPVLEVTNKIFSNPKWHLVDDDHSLHKTFFSLDWNVLLY